MSLALVALAAAPLFSGAAAMRHLEAQVAFGPRVPGSAAHTACLTYLERQFRATGARVTRERFTARVPEGTLQLTNLVATLGAGRGDPVVVGAHWDSRPRSEQDPHPEHRTLPTPGANDGASGVAVLLELARVLGASPSAREVRLVAFDGEDWGESPATMFFGSRAYVARHRAELPRWGVLLDMVGRTGARFPREGFSWTRARPLSDRVVTTARRLGHASTFPDEVGPEVVDDHLSFLDAGVPMVNLIAFDDPNWHTVHDLPGECSPTTLERVGRVVLDLLGASR